MSLRARERWSATAHYAVMGVDVDDLDIVADAKKKRVRAQLGGFLRDLRNGVGNQALGGVMGLSEITVTLLRIEPSTGVRWLASNLIRDCNGNLHWAIERMLKSQACETDAQLSEHLRGWSEVFERYQTLVFATYSTFVALSGVSPWEFDTYRRWREHDAQFIDALKQVEHMEGAEELAPALKLRWGQDNRPAPPAAMPTGTGKFPATAPPDATKADEQPSA